MPANYFTADEANAILPEIRPLMRDLLERRARIALAHQRLDHILSGRKSDVGNADASLVARDMIAVETLIEKIEAFGCQVKDINVGLLDFLARIDGREVLLCWRYDEPRIAYYHDLTGGFSGRRPLDG